VVVLSFAEVVGLGEAASGIVAVLAVVVAAPAAVNHCRFVQQAKHEVPSLTGFHPQSESYHSPFSPAAAADVP
jgi:hypothetical protein